jgi:hypothetical protein
MSSIARRLASLGFSRQLYDFSLGSLPSGVTLTRASAGYRYNSSGVLVSETTDVARFQYDPATLTARGLLVEEATTEILTYSEQFDNAGWSKVRASITANGAVAPDGTTTMDLLTEDATATSSHYVSKNFSFTTGVTYVMQVDVKASTRSWIYMSFPTTGNPSAYFNCGAGVGALGTATGCTSFIQDLGNNIYRCSLICTSLTTNTAAWSVSLTTGNATPTYSGDGVSGLYIWGAQCRVGSATTSYIQTVASTVARAADVALITNASAISDQCWIIRARTPRRISGAAANMVLTVDNGGSFDRRLIYYSTAGTLIAAAVIGNVTTGNMILGSVAADTDFAVAVRWADNNFAASLNGGAIVTDLSGANPLGLTTARLGRDSIGNYWNSTIKTIETRRTASDTELPLLSA